MDIFFALTVRQTSHLLEHWEGVVGVEVVGFSSLVAGTFKINFLFFPGRSLYSSKLIIIQIFLIPYRVSQIRKSVPAGNFTYNGLYSRDLILFSFSVHKERQGTPEKLAFPYHLHHSGWRRTFYRCERVCTAQRDNERHEVRVEERKIEVPFPS